MKSKVPANKPIDRGREVRLTVRLTADDKARLESLRVRMSPYAPLSLGKALSAAIQIAHETLPKVRGS